MKRTAIMVLLLLAVAAWVGCNGVVLSPTYSRLLDDTAAVSAETARRAEAGELSAGQMTDALSAQADLWQRFQAARDGEAD